MSSTTTTRKTKLLSTIAASIFVLTMSGCVSIIKGADQTVTFASEPSNAEVLVDGLSMGKTPLTVSLKKNKYSSILIKKDGYRSQSRPLEKKYDALALLNVFWDLSTTDMISGAAYEYQPNSYFFSLEKAEPETSSNTVK